MRNFAIVTVAACAFFAQPTAAQASCSNQNIGIVKNVSGDVQIVGSRGSRAATSGARVNECDTIRTGRNGRVGITLSDDTRMALGPNSEISMDEYEYDRVGQTGRSVTRVNRGRLGVKSGGITRSGRDNMRVRTPTSTLGVRGTTFVVEVAG